MTTTQIKTRERVLEETLLAVLQAFKDNDPSGEHPWIPGADAAKVIEKIHNGLNVPTQGVVLEEATIALLEQEIEREQANLERLRDTWPQNVNCFAFALHGASLRETATRHSKLVEYLETKRKQNQT